MTTIMPDPEPYFQDDSTTLHLGDALNILSRLPDGSIDCCVTSPPYFGLRDYGEAGQYGLEASPAEYVETMRAVFAEVRRVLADDGTLWLNIGDSYASSTKGSGGTGRSTLVGTPNSGNGQLMAEPVRLDCGVPAKNLLGIPWRTAFALQDDGWILRNDIIWAKQNGMPTSVLDRFGSRHEHMFLLAKRSSYWFDLDAVRSPHAETSIARYARPVVFTSGHPSSASVGQAGNSIAAGHEPERGVNPGDVWSLPTQPFPDAHFAVMPQALAERAILAGCKPNGVVLDPFSGSGTTGLAAAKHGRRYVGIDLSRDYLDLSLRTRLAQPGLDFSEGIA